ncbi:TPA: hypothetical protein HA251_03465 [Candidatus Woesearchaeota archaeon]|nr:hypothetical protein [Candidatus Woesearchaeota archaeon]
MTVSAIKHITVNVEIPPGVAIGDLSRKYPAIPFNIINGHWISSDERVLYITCKDWTKAYFEYLNSHSTVKHIEQIGNVAKIRIKSSFLKKFEQKEMTILYPTFLQNGLHKIDFLINQQQMDSLKKAIPGVTILKIADSYKAALKLTDRQEAIVWKAYGLGYFKYPRDITLTDLAKLLNISKATLSQTLRTVENRAIKQLLEK